MGTLAVKLSSTVADNKWMKACLPTCTQVPVTSALSVAPCCVSANAGALASGVTNQTWHALCVTRLTIGPAITAGIYCSEIICSYQKQQEEKCTLLFFGFKRYGRYTRLHFLPQWALPVTVFAHKFAFVWLFKMQIKKQVKVQAVLQM